MSLIIPNDCLRPSFTTVIARHLEAGRTVNVFGQETHGLNRLVEDLKRCCPGEAKFVRINMRSFADSYHGFLEAVCTSLEIPTQKDLDFRSLLNRFLNASDKQIWLCLEHFDRLSERSVGDKNVDTKGYDIDFLNYLNSLGNNNRVSLLLTTSKEIKTQELYIGGQRVRGSRIDISQRHALEKLTIKEIEDHLRREMPDNNAKKALFKDKPPHYQPLIAEIYAHRAPLQFLEFIAAKIPAHPATMDEFQDLLKAWKREYNASFGQTTDLQISNFERYVRILYDRVTRLLGISQSLQKTNKKILLILAVISAIGLAWWNWGMNIWTWISAHNPF